MKIRYKSRSNSLFTYGRVYEAKITSVGREGWKSPSLMIFNITLAHGSYKDTVYRITPFEFDRFWKFNTINDVISGALHFIYPSHLMKNLIYSRNPLLEMIKPSEGFGGTYVVGNK